MAYFPFFVDLRNKKIYIIGGGRVAFRKIEALLEFEAEITVIAPDICDEIIELKDRIQIVKRAYLKKDMEDAFAVIAATDDTVINSEIAAYCKSQNILINAVDEFKNCSFLFPAYIRKGDISIGITTSGKSPIMAGHMKNLILAALPGYYEALVDTLGGFRQYIKNKITSAGLRANIFKRLADIGLQNNGKLTKEDVDATIRELEQDSGRK